MSGSERYAAENFGPARAAEIADVLHTYGRLQSRRKPELLNRHISLDPDKDLARTRRRWSTTTRATRSA